MAFTGPSMLTGGGILTSLIGGGVKAYGDYQAGIAKAAGYTAEADVDTKLATAERDAASATAAAGFRGAQQVGLRAGAGIARQTVEAGAGNIDVATGSTAQVRASQVALAGSEQRETFQKYREEEYQMDLTAAEKTAEAGRYTTAAGYAKEEGTISAVGDIASAVGSSTQLAGKWYQMG